jgi:hypothetical protein
MLHVYAETSRTIAFAREEQGSYRWIGEQEAHTGPHEFRTPDGLRSERITITHPYSRADLGSKVPMDVYPERLLISYFGDDRRLLARWPLKLADVQPVLEEWLALRAETTESTP